MEKVTTDTIINVMKDWVENKTPISPHIYVDGAMKLNILLGDETDKLFELESEIANQKARLLSDTEKRTVSHVNVIIEATPEFKEMRQQKARIDRIQEFIRLAKKFASLKENEFGNY